MIGHACPIFVQVRTRVRVRSHDFVRVHVRVRVRRLQKLCIRRTVRVRIRVGSAEKSHVRVRASPLQIWTRTRIHVRTLVRVRSSLISAMIVKIWMKWRKDQRSKVNTI